MCIRDRQWLAEADQLIRELTSELPARATAYDMESLDVYKRQVVELGVEAVCSKQLVVAALLHNEMCIRDRGCTIGNAVPHKALALIQTHDRPVLGGAARGDV